MVHIGNDFFKLGTHWNFSLSNIHRKSKRHFLTFPTPFGRVTNSMEIWGGKSGMLNYVRVERLHFVGRYHLRAARNVLAARDRDVTV